MIQVTLKKPGPLGLSDVCQFRLMKCSLSQETKVFLQEIINMSQLFYVCKRTHIYIIHNLALLSPWIHHEKAVKW